MGSKYNQIFELFPKYKLSKRTAERLHPVDFLKPIKLGQFVVKNKEVKETVDNVEDFFLKFTMEKFERDQHLSLKVEDDQRTEPDDNLLMSCSELNTLLKEILKNKEQYLIRKNTVENKSTESKPNADAKDKSTSENESKIAEKASTSKDESGLAGALNKMNLNTGDNRPTKYLYTDFVGLRSTFVSLLNCQYTYKTTFTIYAEKFGESIYLILDKGVDRADELINHAYANRKFKELCTTQFDKKSADGEVIVGEASKPIEFEKYAYHDLCFIFKSKVDRHRLLYSAKMNCFEDNTNLSDIPLLSSRIKSVELKTCRKFENERHESNFRSYKTVKYWSHSVLTNNKKVFVAFFDDDYKVDEIREYRLQDLTRAGNWSSRICFHQFEKLLWFIKRSFLEKKVNMLKFHHQSSSGQFVCEESDKQIVPEWFKEEISKSTN